MSKPANILSRRQFIRQAACAAVGTTAIASTIFDLRLIKAALAQGSFTDYKALVCIFLYGGNDSNNFLIPTSPTEYAAYAAARQNLALAQNTLLPINPLDGRSFGLHPSASGLQTLFESGKLGILCNVGTLVGPVSRAQYLAGSAAVPPQLFSHNDQQVQWQTSIPDQQSRTGWGGRCADLLYSANTGAQISMNISLAGANTFEVGNIVSQYQVTSSGSVGLSNTNRVPQIKAILAQPHTNLFEQSYAEITDRALVNNELLTAALGSVAEPTGFPAGNSSSLSAQLKMIAKLIAARNALSMKRQIFFCSVGGYDTHGEQINTHATLLGELSAAVKAFYDYMVILGIQDGVTAFTASDFSRTFPSNGIGSDHAWGGHQLIVGGAVQGKQLYGTFPTLAVNGPDDTSQGRWIPTTAVDEYSATLAKWFGVTNSNLDTVFPNLHRFAHRDLGFLA